MSVKFPSHNVAEALERSLKNADGLKAVTRIDTMTAAD